MYIYVKVDPLIDSFDCDFYGFEGIQVDLSCD